jgi:hypothetical protein
MFRRSIHALILLTGASALALVACDDAPPTEPGSADAAVGVASIDQLAERHGPNINAQLAELRQKTAKWHDIDAAVADGYDLNIGCVDERVAGLPASEARGMGYHVTPSDAFGPTGIIGNARPDGLLNPELLVYAPAQNDADLPPESRVRASRLVGFDYFVPGSPTDDPPTMFGDPYRWSEAFGGWMFHIYAWGHNPDGITTDWNPAVRLCTDLVAGEPIE